MPKSVHVNSAVSFLARKSFLPVNMVFSLEAASVMEIANAEAYRFGRKSIGLEHLFLAVCNLSAAMIAFGRQNVTMDEPRRCMESAIQFAGEFVADGSDLRLNDIAEKVINLANGFATMSRERWILPFHILLAVAQTAADMPRCSVALAIKRLKIDPNRFLQDIKSIVNI